MVFNTLPWPDEITLNTIERPELTYPPNCDPYLVDLLSQMLAIDPNKRPTMIEVLNSDFFRHVEQLNGQFNDPFDSRKSESSIRASISLRDAHNPKKEQFRTTVPKCNIPSFSPTNRRITLCAYTRMKSLNPQLERGRRSSARSIPRPHLTFNE